MRTMLTAACLAALVLPLASTDLEAARRKPGDPDKVKVQHILIGYRKTVPGKVLDRSRKEARELAASLFERAQAGEEFDALVKEHTDDSYPGIYVMNNFGLPKKAGEWTRDGMVPSFGDVAFSLEIGEIGMAPHHAAKSPYGWHIVKRLE